MKKLFLILISIALIVLVGFYFLAGSIINKAVMYGAETLAPELLGVTVELESVDISPFTGTGTIKGLMVGNPEGYSSEKAFSFKEIYVSLSPLSVFSDVIHIKEVRIIAPEFIYEKKLSGSNIDELIQKLDSFSSADSSPPVKFKIDILTVEDGTITVVALGMSHELPLPSVTIENLGGENGTTAGEAFSEILKSVYSEVTNSIRDRGVEVLKDVRDTAKGIGDTIKSLFGN